MQSLDDASANHHDLTSPTGRGRAEKRAGGGRLADAVGLLGSEGARALGHAGSRLCGVQRRTRTVPDRHREHDESGTVQRLWDHMPPTPGTEHEISGVEINPAGLLPHEFAYFTYAGSQTAPPCTEGVTWIVLRTPVEVSTEQIEAFAKLYPHDVRPLQPRNGRAINESP